jgi:hypothetical protein
MSKSNTAGFAAVKFESEWQSMWVKRGDFLAPSREWWGSTFREQSNTRDMSRAKYTAPGMFPNPSRAGLHVAHHEGVHRHRHRYQIPEKPGKNLERSANWTSSIDQIRDRRTNDTESKDSNPRSPQ